MMGIENHLKTIKEGVFGRDIRQAIHDGLEEAYHDASLNGNANMEVSIARGGFDNLRERLDSVDEINTSINGDVKLLDNKFNNLIATAGNGTLPTELIDIRVGYDGRNYKTAGEATRQQFIGLDNKMSEINSLISDTVTRLNLLSTVSKVVIGELVRHTNDGSDNAIWIDSGVRKYLFIKIEPNTTYFFNVMTTSISQAAFFASDDIKSGLKYFTNMGLNQWNTTVTSPANANYLVIEDSPSIAQTRFFGTVDNHQKYLEKGADIVLNVKTDVKDYVTIGASGADFKTVKDGFAEAIKLGLPAKILPGVYDLVAEGISGKGYVAPKVVYGYGATLLCNLPSEDWLLSPLNILAGSTGSEIHGLTIIASNCRYCIHDDMGVSGGGYSPFYKNVYKDLVLIHNSVPSSVLLAPQCIGGGFGDEGYIEATNCVFESKMHSDVSYHSKAVNPSSAQRGNCIMKVTNSKFKNRLSVSKNGTYTNYMNVIYISSCKLGSQLDTSVQDNIKIEEWNNTIKST
ncbi:hypothetical protein ACR3IL_00680 [Streptococcus iniae]|nr:hypothetical protein Javan275_0005 [Streptococcus phage Javan275]